jgi:hypothetical protein
MENPIPIPIRLPLEREWTLVGNSGQYDPRSCGCKYRGHFGCVFAPIIWNPTSFATKVFQIAEEKEDTDEILAEIQLLVDGLQIKVTKAYNNLLKIMRRLIVKYGPEFKSFQDQIALLSSNPQAIIKLADQMYKIKPHKKLIIMINKMKEYLRGIKDLPYLLECAKLLKEDS